LAARLSFANAWAGVKKLGLASDPGRRKKEVYRGVGVFIFLPIPVQSICYLIPTSSRKNNEQVAKAMSPGIAFRIFIFLLIGIQQPIYHAFPTPPGRFVMGGHGFVTDIFLRN